jgi:hypothetical protein
MAGNDASAKFFEAVNESSDTLIDAIRAGNDRNHRIATGMIEEAQEGQRELVDLAKKWVANPLDILGFYSSIVDSTTKAQARGLDITRQWFAEMAAMQKETRQVLQKLATANRNAGEASLDVARGMFSRTAAQVNAGTNGDGRRASRETAKAS